MNRAGLDDVWFTSSACTTGNCVQVRPIDGGATIAVRDSKAPETVLYYSAEEWHDFLDGIARGDFDSFAPR
jgi:putative sterol carrier protein